MDRGGGVTAYLKEVQPVIDLLRQTTCTLLAPSSPYLTPAKQIHFRKEKKKG